ncbi:hypothetical protein GCM10010869_32220 [Mesorhizobium tianshanense]|uniref:Uncharacterized protein n=1 Tax=Mesorhizobium tianshanense TaxID=39844 RepID=A0A562P5F0_9HYPH|nr:hypothetical protein [Mesorhizobium tianshanense]TWI39672.1 hypothetical protein IQ26_01902 [Mesorhizobium tianshanense]GLS37628.1 hypothetical protein GCM10010869_32220 [Mesorhizobium tianshanense]
MTNALHHAALPWIVAFATVLMSALAKNVLAAEAPFEITLDMDNDGQMDRAVIAQDPDSEKADLYIYLAAGDGKLDPSRQPSSSRRPLRRAEFLSSKARPRDR